MIKNAAPTMTFYMTSLIEVLAPRPLSTPYQKSLTKNAKKKNASVTGGCILMGFISLGRESFGVSSHAMGLPR